MACPLLPPFLVTFPGVKPWDSVNSPSALPSMWNSCQLISPLLFFANLTFLLMPSPYFFKPSSILYTYSHFIPFSYTYSPSSFLFKCLHVLVCRVKSRVKSLAFTVLYNMIHFSVSVLSMSRGFFPHKEAGIQKNQTSWLSLFALRTVLAFLFCVCSLQNLPHMLSPS